ncbi:hypothetical protein [Acinetobacter baumannii]|uniref:hypothetical protein n=1 Tax=Acinetobacter baumannii TaxID=470 RepID=UPI003CC7ABA2
MKKTTKGYQSDLDVLFARMEKLNDRYTAQFAAMDAMISKLQGSTSSLSGLLTG